MIAQATTIPTAAAVQQLDLIREYVDLQSKLLQSAAAHWHCDSTCYTFQRSLPPTVTLDGTAWNAQPHGLGIRFTHPTTGLVVDPHLGVLDAPSAFDASRLQQYAASRSHAPATPGTYLSWHAVLDDLAQSREILPHPSYDRHYLLA